MMVLADVFRERLTAGADHMQPQHEVTLYCTLPPSSPLRLGVSTVPAAFTQTQTHIQQAGTHKLHHIYTPHTVGLLHGRQS